MLRLLGLGLLVEMERVGNSPGAPEWKEEMEQGSGSSVSIIESSDLMVKLDGGFDLEIEGPGEGSMKVSVHP